MYLIKLSEIPLSQIPLKLPSQYSGFYLSQYSTSIFLLLQPYFKRLSTALRQSLSQMVRWQHLYIENTGPRACMCRQHDRIIKWVRETRCIQWTQADLMYCKSSPALCSLLEKHFADAHVLSALCRGSCSELCLETARKHKSLFKGQYFKVLQNGHFTFSSVKAESIGSKKKTSTRQSH